MFKNALVVFIEGADGVGKTTFIKTLTERLFSDKLYVVNTHLIALTDFGKVFYQDFTNSKYNDLTAALGMLSVTTASISKLNEMKSDYNIIIVDRSQASFFAYQLNSQEIKEALLTSYEKSLAAKFYNVSNYVTIYLECEANVAKNRMLTGRGSLDAIEARGISFQNDAKAAYEECFTKYPQLAPKLRIDTGVNNEKQTLELGYNLVKSLMV